MSEYSFPVVELGTAIVVGCMARVVYLHHNVADRCANTVMRSVQQRTCDAGFDYDERTLYTLVGTGLVVSILVGAVISPALALFSPFIASLSAWLFLGSRKKSQERSKRKIYDEMCYYIGRQLRAGYPLDKAIFACSEPFGSLPIVQSIARHQRAGASLTQSIECIEKENGEITTPEKMLCATIILAQSMGGNSARIFERIGDSFHQSYELIDDTSSALAQVRMSMYVIGSLPVVMVIFSLMLGSGSTMFLFTQPAGWVCLVIGIALEIAGIAWMKKLVAHGVGTWTS